MQIKKIGNHFQKPKVKQSVPTQLSNAQLEAIASNPLIKFAQDLI